MTNIEIHDDIFARIKDSVVLITGKATSSIQTKYMLMSSRQVALLESVEPLLNYALIWAQLLSSVT